MELMFNRLIPQCLYSIYLTVCVKVSLLGYLLAQYKQTVKKLKDFALFYKECSNNSVLFAKQVRDKK